jgi:hypothetical protein
MRKIVMLFVSAALVAGLATPAFADEGRRHDRDRSEHSDRDWRGHDHDRDDG